MKQQMDFQNDNVDDAEQNQLLLLRPLQDLKVIQVLLVLLHLNPYNGNDMMDLIHLNDEHVDYDLFLDLLPVMVIQMYVDEVDIENKKNHFVLKEEVEVQVEVVDEYKIMDLVIAKMNYPVLFHWIVMLDKKQSHTFEVIHDDVVVQMDGLDIGET
jgi:hypothetical protein